MSAANVPSRFYSLPSDAMGRSYCNNLLLVERALGVLLRSVKAAGLNESTALIIKADHWWWPSPRAECETSSRIALPTIAPGSPAQGAAHPYLLCIGILNRFGSCGGCPAHAVRYLRDFKKGRDNCEYPIR